MLFYDSSSGLHMVEFATVAQRFSAKKLSQKFNKIHSKIPVEFLFSKTAGYGSATLLKRTFATCVFLWTQQRI